MKCWCAISFYGSATATPFLERESEERGREMVEFELQRRERWRNGDDFGSV